ncbi:MAG: OmpA family protein [Nitrospiria bacterium]
MKEPAQTNAKYIITCLLIFLLVLLVEGCVTKDRFMSQVSETQGLARQLGEVQQAHDDLKREAVALKKRLANLSAALTDAQEEAAQRERVLGDEKQGLETALARSKQDLSALEHRLAEKETEAAALKKRLENLSAALSAAKKEAAQRERVLRVEKQGLETALAQSKQDLSALEHRLAAKADALEALRAEHDAVHQENEKLREALELSEADLERMKREIKESSKAHQDLVRGLKKEIDEGSIKIKKLKNRLHVEIVDSILFASGSDRITLEGKGVLTKVSDVLKDVRENDIRIEGHTDHVPIGPKIIDKFPTNWELSTARSTQVVRFLFGQGVQPENMQAAGFSKYRPVASNEIPEGRRRNRRIEIVLFPRDLLRLAEAVE